MDDKKQRIRELEKEYLKLSRKEVRLIRKQQNYLIDTSQERKKLNALTYSPCLKAGDSWIQTILAY